MSRLKIEDLSVASCKRTAASEYLSARKPSGKHDIIRFRDIEIFAVHLFLPDLDLLRDPRLDRMRRIDTPQTLPVPVSPF